MPTATLNKVNQGLNHMVKQFTIPGSAYGGKSISVIKKVISVTTTKESVKASDAILSDLLEYIGIMPTKDSQINLGDLKKVIDKTNNNIQFVNIILTDIQNVVDVGGKIEVDDKNMLKFIYNFNEIKKYLEYVSDYLALVMQIQKAKVEIKKGKYIDYTLDELLVKLKAA